MKRATYICLEGTEGVGKTTQTQKLVDYLRSRGYSVLQTKEPGTPLSPLTMQLRGIMLDKQYDEELTRPARELVSQAIRSIHLERIVVPALSQYDFIVQDRGILSGLAYGTGCGNSVEFIESLVAAVVPEEHFKGSPYLMYDHVVYLTGSTKKGLDRALTSKKEFEKGDAMEAKGVAFLNDVSDRMDTMSRSFNTTKVDVENKNIDQVFSEILAALGLEQGLSYEQESSGV